MQAEWIAIISLLGGFAAGVINTLAGNGSVITLGILTEVIGLPANIANGTNRLGVWLQSGSSYLGLKTSIPFDYKNHLKLITWILLGAICGAVTAVFIDNETFTVVYEVMMVVMLFTILAKPDRWLKAKELPPKDSPEWLISGVYLLLGFYGGFIQMGMGLLFLAVTVLFGGKTIMTSNVLKSIIVLIFTTAVLAIFAWRGLIDWRAGALLAIGQGVGGWVGGRYVARSAHATAIAYYTLLIMVIFVLVKMFFL